MKELLEAGLYQTLANKECQLRVLEKVSQQILNGGLSRHDYESIKNYIIPSGLDVEKLIQLNLERGFIEWTSAQGEDRLVRVEIGEEVINDGRAR